MAMNESGVLNQIQTILQVPHDGIWGPKSQAGLNREVRRTSALGNPRLRTIQAILGGREDGFWGRESQALLNQLVERNEVFTAMASSFADPADLAAFIRCKDSGKSDKQCFKMGDNGIGQFGKITAQTHTPMVALHADDMIAKWGSVAGAAHRIVKVSFGPRMVVASVEDRLGARGRIDLNPAASKILGITPPFLVKCTWSWA